MLLEKLIGSQSTINTDEQLGVKNTINQTTTGQTNVTGQDVGTSVMTADIGRLADVYNRQAAGVTPEMLQAIFREGSKAAPQLVSSTANAVGARSGGNSPLATALGELQSNLVGQAAKLNTDMLGQAGQTAAQIGALTRQVTDTKNTNQATTSGQNVLTNQDQLSTKGSDTTRRDTINTKSTALTGGALALASLLKNSGIDAGTIAGLLKKIGIGDSGLSLGDAANTGFGDGTGLGGDWYTPTFGEDTAGLGEGFGGIFGWKDGGIVPTPQLGFDTKKVLGQR
jgi:hypothetical protein